MATCGTCSHDLGEIHAKYCTACGALLAAAEGPRPLASAGASDTWLASRAEERPAPPLPYPGLVDNRYLPERELGRGSMGIVFLARDIHLRRAVALKMLPPDLAQNTQVVTHLQREAAALAALRSDHVVQVYAFGPHEGSYFFAMEFVKGPSLEAIIDEYAAHGARVPAERALTVLRQIAAGLDAVHRAGLVHRDVKPGNIVVEEGTGRAVLVDFGLALSNDHRSLNAVVGGTPAYMAPEQATETTVTTRADVYAFACTAFELLTGKLPFDARTAIGLVHLHKTAEPPRPSSVAGDCLRFDAALLRGLSKAPERRPATAGELVSELAARRVAPAPVAQATEGARRVLVIDDDPAFVKFAARAVGLAFYGVRLRVTACTSGAEAVDHARVAMPDLVLLDYDMPGLNGFETLSRIRDVPRGAEARILVVSASVGRSEAWRFGVLGVEDFVSKPVELAALVAAITKIAAAAGWANSESVPMTRR